MRKLYGEMPTELDLENTKVEINNLERQNNFLNPKIQLTFCAQIDSARSQLKAIVVDLQKINLLIFAQSRLLRNELSTS